MRVASHHSPSPAQGWAGAGDWPALKSAHQIAAIAYDLVALVSDYTVAKGSDAERLSTPSR